MLNVVSIKPADPEPGSTLEYALKYAAIGWKVVPIWWVKEDGRCACGKADCGNVGKHPIGTLAPFGQNSATDDPATIRGWFARHPEANIAVYLKPTGLCAIDIDPRNGGYDTIDNIERQHGALRSDLLQYSGGGGEHRIFQAPASDNLPGKLGPGVDVKLNGYIVLEPSNHKSGKRYAFDAESDPLDGAVASPLPDWLRNMAVASMPAMVHDALPAPLSQEQLSEIVEALTFVDSDDRDTWYKVGMALHNDVGGQQGFTIWDEWSQSSPKYNPVDQVRVWRSFSRRGLSGITKASVFQMAMESGWTNTGPKATPESTIYVTDDEPETVSLVNDAPVELLRPPGILADIADYITSTAHRPNPVLSVTAALSLAGLVLGRKVATQTGLRTNMYFVSVADTAAGKDHPRKVIKDILKAARLSDFLGGEDIPSGTGLLSAVYAQPNVLFQLDEFGLLMQSVQSPKAGSHQASILTNLIKLFSSASTTVIGAEYANRKDRPRQDIDYPCAHLHATTTGQTLFPALESSHVTSGYLNRMIVTFAPEGRPAKQPATWQQPPMKVLEWIERARSMSHGLLGLNPDAPIVYGMDKAASRLFDEFDADIDQRMDKAEGLGTSPLWGRAWEHAAKLALIAAAAESLDRHSISEKAAQYAINFIRHHTERIEQEVITRVAENDFHRAVKQVEEVIWKSGKRGRTEREISQWSRKFASANPFLRDQILSVLKRDEKIALVNIVGQNGKTRAAYVASQHRECADQ